MKMNTRSIMCLLVLGVTLVFGLLGLHLTPTFLNWSGDILINTVGGVSRSADPRASGSPFWGVPPQKHVCMPAHGHPRV